MSGYGWGVEVLWQGLLSGRAAIREISRFDPTGHRTRLAAEVPGTSESAAPDIDRAGVPAARGAGAKHSLAEEFALAAAAEAIADAGLPAGFASGRRTAVLFGSSTGGMFEAEGFYSELGRRSGAFRPAVRVLISQPTSGPADAVARAIGASGPVRTISSACASASLALGEALDALRAGEIDVAVAGGSDALCQLTYAGFNSLRSVDVRPSRPFRADREGLSLGEGAAVLVLERESSAAERGARPRAFLGGFGATCDAHHMTAPDPSGRGVARAIRLALEDAGEGPDAVAFLNAHGTGTPLNDAAEHAALREVFGERAGAIPVTSNKGAIGHFLGSAGAVEAVVTVLSLLRSIVPQTPGEGPIDSRTPVDLVLGEPRSIGRGDGIGGIGLSTNFAFGGSNSALVFQPVPAGGGH